MEITTKEYFENLQKIRYNLEANTSYHPDIIVIHPKSRPFLERFVKELLPNEFDNIRQIDSFFGLKVVESELFTTPKTAIIISGESMNKVIENDEYFLMRFIGVEIPIP